MNRKITWSLLTLVVLAGALLSSIQSAASSSSNRQLVPRAARATPYLMVPLTTTLDVDRTDDTAAATACTAAANDCSLRGAIIAANTNVSADPVVINLQPASTYNLTLANATQENAAATGDLDITTILHTVTIVGGGSSGPSASIIDAAGLTSGNMHDRAFQITASGVTVTFQDLAIRNAQAADDGTSGASTNPTSQNSTRAGGGILNGAGIDVNLVTVNGGGSVTLDNVAIDSCQILGKGDDQVNQHRTLDAWGGGLASLGTTGNVIITGSTFTGNSALGGDGGNFNNGGGSGVRGGSIYFEGGTLNVDGSRIANSNATGGNGGNGPGNQQNGGQGGIAQGGGAYIGGTASINNSTFENCAAGGGNSGTGQNGTNAGADAGGGGLYSLGTVTVTNSTFDLNSATGGDAGDSFGPDCFGAHESGDGGAARGGAILAEAGSLIVNTATLANNSANGGNGGDGGKTNGGGACAQTSHGAGGLAHGGAITNTNAATVNINHGTISLNNAQAGNTGVNQAGANLPPRLVAEGTGGGIRVGPGGVTLENTIIAGNTAANGLGDTTGAPTAGPNVDGAVMSNGHNLLGVATEATGFTGTGDQTGANPMLAALADNGGPTQTMALSPGSPAIDAGVAAGATFDQRGLPRTVDDPGVPNAAGSDGTDIGAYEAPVICNLTCPANVIVSNDTDQCGAVVDYTEPSGSSCGTVTCDHPSGTFFPVGNTTVVCTSSVGPACTFVVTVNDTQNPVISAPPNASYQCPSQVPAAAPSQATASDNCGTATVTVSESTNGGAGSPASPLIITRTYTATDVHGNMSSAVQVITVVDNTPPQISCPVSIIADFNPAVNGAVVSYTAPVGTDNCGSSTTAQITGLTSGATFPLGTTTNTFRVTDTAGNTAQCSFTVTVAITSIIGLESVSISGSGYVDSYDSTIGYPASKSSLANVLSNGTITIAGSGKVWGNVRSTRAGVNMSGASQVTGNATAGTTVLLSGSASVGGIKTNNALAPVMVLPAVPVCGPPYSSNSGISGTYSYNSGTGDLSLSGVNNATLTNGTYCFHNINLTNSAQLKVNGLVVIKLTGTLNASGATSFSNMTGLPANLRILSSFASGGNGVVFGNSTNVHLVIYAPGTGVSISGAAPLFGTVAGKTITVGNSGAIHYDTRLKTIWPDIWAVL
ncbi:MAG TPA: choice-of-anchor Q domain-containing protein [Pyrinomonadaceae bacterium]|nr:choice-of-anchor Q domain-containing protein [Pyrinomonadaceae bacterium]